jgi:hypothetical protein
MLEEEITGGENMIVVDIIYKCVFLKRRIASWPAAQEGSDVSSTKVNP